MKEDKTLSVIFNQDFEVLRPLGRGGRSYVYHVKERATASEFALKVIEKSRISSEYQLKQVQNEIKIHSGLVHPSIIHLHEHFEDNENIYLVLELCLGGELFSYIKAEGRLSESETRELCRHLVQGIQYLHSKGILHRDLKLGNLLLSEERTLKIADFGLSTLLSDVDLCHGVCGTPNYLAPEVFMKKPYGLPSDLWSLGCVLFACLVGRPPFDSSDVRATFKRAGKLNYQLPTFLSEEAQDLISGLLTLNPDQRLPINQVWQHPFFKGPGSEVKDVEVFDSTDSGVDGYKVIPLFTKNLKPFKHSLKGGGELQIDEGGWIRVKLNNRYLEVRGGTILYQGKPCLLHSMPKSAMKLYNYVRQIVAVIQSKTPYVKIKERDCEFILMSDFPHPHFEVRYGNGDVAYYQADSDMIHLKSKISGTRNINIFEYHEEEFVVHLLDALKRCSETVQM